MRRREKGSGHGTRAPTLVTPSCPSSPSAGALPAGALIAAGALPIAETPRVARAPLVTPTAGDLYVLAPLGAHRRALDLDALRLLDGRGALEGHLEDPVLEPGPDVVLVDAFGQLQAPPERAAPALPH